MMATQADSGRSFSAKKFGMMTTRRRGIEWNGDGDVKSDPENDANIPKILTGDSRFDATAIQQASNANQAIRQ
jgi:hypothetical protein